MTCMVNDHKTIFQKSIGNGMRIEMEQNGQKFEITCIENTNTKYIGKFSTSELLYMELCARIQYFEIYDHAYF